jgi:hypothetical protein
MKTLRFVPLSVRASAISGALLLSSVLVSMPLQAAVVDSVGDSFGINFNGIVDEVVQPGLTSNAMFTLASIVSDGHGGQNWTFNVTVNNTSFLPITGSRVSILAFNTDPNADRAESAASGVFDMITTGNMPMVGDMELCFKDAGGNNCAGGGSGGVTQGNSGNFTAKLNFNTVLSQLVLTNFHVRYQSIAGSTLGTSGVGEEVVVVPVPAAAWLMGSGLIGLAGLAKRKKI